MDRKITATILLAAISGMVGCSSPSSQSSAAQVADGSGDKSKLICKTVKPTGSRIGERTCYTAEKWEEMRTASREKMREVDARSGQQNPDGT